jgi:hypothetical protein
MRLRILTSFIILIDYLLGFINSFSEERGFLVTQDSNISEPYKYIDYVSSSVDNTISCPPEGDYSGLVQQCINGLIYSAKGRGADGIISLTWKINHWIPNGWHSYVCRLDCHGMAIKRESNH